MLAVRVANMPSGHHKECQQLESGAWKETQLSLPQTTPSGPGRRPESEDISRSVHLQLSSGYFPLGTGSLCFQDCILPRDTRGTAGGWNQVSGQRPSLAQLCRRSGHLQLSCSCRPLLTGSPGLQEVPSCLGTLLRLLGAGVRCVDRDLAQHSIDNTFRLWTVARVRGDEQDICAPTAQHIARNNCLYIQF